MPTKISQTIERRLPVGAEAVEGGVCFRVWAPDRKTVEVVTDTVAAPLTAESDGYFSGSVGAPAPGRLSFPARRRGLIPILPRAFSRRDRMGPPRRRSAPFRWTDSDWKGMSPEGQILYEMHIGTFTREGTWAAAAHELPELARIGITIVEVMPIAEFAGRFGWGYDGVDLYAPTQLYGGPDDFRRFVDVAHAVGVGVILDVVYNHLARPGTTSGSSRPSTSPIATRTSGARRSTSTAQDSRSGARVLRRERGLLDRRVPPGRAPPRRDPGRSSIDSDEHILTGIGRREARAGGRGAARRHRRERTAADRLVRSTDDGGYGLDALWNDDFHHSAMVALTGRGEAYYSDTRGDPAGVHLGGQIRLPVPGSALPLASAASRLGGLGAARHAPSSPSSRTTIRWPTRREVSAS